MKNRYQKHNSLERLIYSKILMTNLGLRVFRYIQKVLFIRCKSKAHFRKMIGLFFRDISNGRFGFNNKKNSLK